MNKFLLAEMLNGREYRNEITQDIEEALKGTDLVIVFGASDDLMEFYGAIRNEVGCFGGGTAYVTNKGLLENECSACDCPCFNEQKESAQKITAHWDVQGYSWVILTDIPYAVFHILEDGDTYCRGIVFNLSEVV